jgi:dienelactone hydrolase
MQSIAMRMALVATMAATAAARAEDVNPSATSGVVEFTPLGDQSALPRQFRLAAHTFRFEQAPLPTLSKVMTVSKLTFPSPVVTPHANNNTVHCEYFCPTAPGRKPAVVVLHILGGDFDLARMICRALASRGTATLFLKMPYYGERRQQGSPARMVSLDVEETARGMTQAVLDIRRAAGWLASRQEIDAAQVGILGISLGGITAALAAGIEPRFSKACFILAGGGMGEVVWNAPQMAELRERWLAAGHTKEELFEALKPVDPVTYARPAAGRQILMFNARRDEVIPPACSVALWRAFGEPEIVWWDAGHYTAIRYLASGVAKAADFFQSDRSAAAAHMIAK